MISYYWGGGIAEVLHDNHLKDTSKPNMETPLPPSTTVQTTDFDTVLIVPGYDSDVLLSQATGLGNSSSSHIQSVSSQIH
jgi:hypothetical protein